MNKIYLSGSVGASFWDEECFTVTDVRGQLEGMSGALTVHLNSGGGIATDGQAIYNALRNYEGHVTIVIDGIAASAASLIAMAGDEIVMPRGSIMMVHDPAQWGIEGRGTEQDHLAAARSLNVIANAYAAIYAARAGISTEAARVIMREETYFDGPAALDAGFATLADDALEAMPAAAFDYRLYARSPEGLREIAGTLTRHRSVASVFAMMTGSPNRKKGNPMRKKAKAATAATETENDEVELELDETDTTDTTEPVDEEQDPEAELEEDPEAEGDEEIDLVDEEDEGAQVAAIIRFATANGVPPAVSGRYIASGMNIKQVMALHPKKGTGMTKARPALARNHSARDERTTRRAAATEALHAQMTGAREVSAAARPYMGKGIVEIAADVSGQSRAPMRNYGQKSDILMNASHATSDFPAIFQNALNKVLLDRYDVLAPTYRLIAKQKNFRDFRPMPLVRSGDFPMLVPVGEGGEIKWGTFGESGEQAVIVPYARGITVSRQMMINDELDAISDLLGSYGEMIAYFEERTFYAAALSAKLADGNALFHASHNNLAGAAAAINRTSLSEGRAAMRKQKSIDGLSLNIAPSILLVGPDKETEAEAIVAEITPTEVGAFNPFSGKLKPVVSAEITGNAWYLLSERAPCWVYGFLEGQEAPRVRTEEPFGTQGFSMTVEHDFGFGAQDFRGGFKNNGA